MTKDEALKMAIEALKQYVGVVQHKVNAETWGDIEDGGKPAIKAIQACKEALEQPAQKPMAWINVFDRLPEPDTEVLTWGSGTASNNYGCMQAWFTRNGWQELDSCGDFCNDISPTHWMPLPNAPKESNDD